MACSAMGIYKRYSEELWDKPSEELIESDKDRISKELPAIVGLTKAIEYSCAHTIEVCECGFRNYDRDKFCRECGEELILTWSFPEYTHYPNTTAQSEDMARSLFLKEYGLDDGDRDNIEITKYIKVMAWASEQQYLQHKKAQDEKFRGYQSMQEAEKSPIPSSASEN